MEGEGLFPSGTLAILERDNEYTLQFELESREKEARRRKDLWAEIENICEKYTA